MTFEEVIKRIAKNKGVKPLRFYLHEDVLIALTGDKIVRGTIIEHTPFYSLETDDPYELMMDGGALDFSTESIKLVREGAKDGKFEQIKAVDIKSIKRITNTSSFFNKKQIEYIKTLGIDPESVKSPEDYDTLYRAVFKDEFKKVNAAEPCDIEPELFKSIYDKIRAICPEIYSKLEQWKYEPLCILDAIEFYDDNDDYEEVNIGVTHIDDEELDKDKVYDQIDQAFELFEAGNARRASGILYELTNHLTHQYPSIYEGDLELHSFSDLFGKMLYLDREKPHREIVDLDIPFSLAYYLYGSSLFDEEKYALAEPELAKAMQWDPCNPICAFEHAEIAKIEGDIRQFYKETMEVMQYAYRPAHIARGYRNIGYYFVEKNKYRYALICFALSLMFEPNNVAKHEILYIAENSPEVISDIPFEEVLEFAEEHNINIGADEEVKKLANYLCVEALHNENPYAARYYYEIYHGMEKNLHTELQLETLREPKKWKLK